MDGADRIDSGTYSTTYFLVNPDGQDGEDVEADLEGDRSAESKEDDKFVLLADGSDGEEELVDLDVLQGSQSPQRRFGPLPRPPSMSPPIFKKDTPTSSPTGQDTHDKTPTPEVVMQHLHSSFTEEDFGLQLIFTGSHNPNGTPPATTSGSTEGSDDDDDALSPQSHTPTFFSPVLGDDDPLSPQSHTPTAFSPYQDDDDPLRAQSHTPTFYSPISGDGDGFPPWSPTWSSTASSKDLTQVNPFWNPPGSLPNLNDSKIQKSLKHLEYLENRLKPLEKKKKVGGKAKRSKKNVLTMQRQVERERLKALGYNGPKV